MGETTLGDILRRHRERLGLSQEDLADRAGSGVSVNTISNIERGRNRPYRHTLEALADALGLAGGEREELLAARTRGTQVVPDAGVSPASPSQPARGPVLPSPATPLVGREREVGEVSALLGRPGVRLVTLTGTGGAGKTRLALEVASRLAGVYPDGVRFIDLSPIRDPALVPSAIATGLGAREEPGQPLPDTLKDHLRESELLLVLDNLEQVLPAAPVLADLLSSAPKLRVLATSRVPLHLYGEHEYTVPPLGLPPTGAAEGEILASEAVRLFAERAEAVRPGFEPTGTNAPTVAEICRRLDGLPLAIELAAARVRLFSPQALLARLGSRLGTLTGGARDLPERQRTLRAALDWSYELLDEGERAFFSRLGVFAGSFDLAAAEAVCDPDGERDVLAGMESLMEQGLVRLDEDGAGEPRFRMLETIREYALARLEEGGGAEDVRRRYAEYYFELAECAEPELQGPRQGEWLERLEREHDNFRAVLSWAMDPNAARPEERAELGLRLAAALGRGRFWVAYGMGEGLMWLERGLARSCAAPASVRAKALDEAGWIALWQGKYEKAMTQLEEALALLEELGDKSGMATSLLHLGHLALHRGDRARLETFRERAEELLRGLTDRGATAHLLLFKAEAALEQGDYDRMDALLEESLALNRELGDLRGLVMGLIVRGLASLEQGDHGRAAAVFEEVLRLLQEMREQVGVVYGLWGMAALSALRGEPGRAARLWGATEALREAIAHPVSAFDRAHYAYERYLSIARAQVDEVAWEAAWAEGRRMRPEQALAYALGERETSLR